MKPSYWTFTEQERQLISSLVTKGRTEQVENDRFAVIDLESFFRLFTDNEVAIMKKWLAIKPAEIDYKLPFLGYTEPDKIVAIANQTYEADGTHIAIPAQYLPEVVHEAYLRLNKAMNADIGKGLLVLSGHRSPDIYLL